MKRFLFISLALAVCAFGQDVASTQVSPQTKAGTREYPEVTAPPRVGISLTQTKLSLVDAVHMAVRNNLEIEIERTNQATAETNGRATRGYFDPTFRWQPLYSLQNTPTASILQGASGKLTDRGFVNNFYYRQQLPKNGTLFHVDFTNNRATTTNPFSSFNPLYTTSLVAGFTQPLLRNRETDLQRTELRVRQKQVDVSKVDFENRVIDVISRVQQGYWDLVAARADAAVKQDTATWAREQLAINQRMVKAGTTAPVELSAAEAELERRLDTWYSSLEIVTSAENNLKSLIAGNRADEIWRDEIVPTDAGTLAPPAADDLYAAVKAALVRRPELRGLGVQKQINEVQRDYAKNQTKPAVDLVANYALNGLGGTLASSANPFSESQIVLYERLNQLSGIASLPPLTGASFGGLPPTFLTGGYGTSLANIFAGRFQSVNAGLSLDFTFRNRTAEANLAQTGITERRLKAQQAQVEQAIEAQVRNAIQGLATSQQRISAAESSVRASQEKLASETRLYQTGESTNFLVLTRQNELSDSRARLISAQRDYNKSVARLQQAIGTTLEDTKVNLQ